MRSTRLTSPTVSIIEQSRQARRDPKTVPGRFQTGVKSVSWWYNNLLWINECLGTLVQWPLLYMCRKKVVKSESACSYVAMWANVLPHTFLYVPDPDSLCDGAPVLENNECTGIYEAKLKLTWWDKSILVHFSCTYCRSWHQCDRALSVAFSFDKSSRVMILGANAFPWCNHGAVL